MNNQIKSKKKPVVTLIVWCCAIFIAMAVLFFNFDAVKRPFIQDARFSIDKININVASSAKYEKDGNIYIIDSGSFRLICMTPEGRIRYTINIDKNKEYVKFFDCAVDELGNLYVYANELEYDAYRTKRDMIRKYDSRGRFAGEIFSLYRDVDNNPHTFPQIGSLYCENGILTFSQVQRDCVNLYAYNTFRNTLDTAVFSRNVADFSVGRLLLKDFDNFIYTTRDGNVYEVTNGGMPQLRASFDFIEGQGGVIPWHITYDSQGDILFFDMASASIFRIDAVGNTAPAVPPEFFDNFRAEGVFPALTGFGHSDGYFAGVFGDIVWHYNGYGFIDYRDGITVSAAEWWRTVAALASLPAAVIFFILGIHCLFSRILNGYISLFIKQTIFLIPVIIAGFIVLYSVTSDFMNRQLQKEILNDLLFKTVASSSRINGDDLAGLRSIKDFQKPEYTAISRALKNIVGNNAEEWNKLYYSAVYKVSENAIYGIAFSNEEVNMFRPYGSIAIEAGTGEYDLVMYGKPFVNIVEQSDSTWAYSNTPVFTANGAFAGIFEMGFDMTSYVLVNAILRREASLIALAICLVILIVSAIVMFIIVRQLASVARVLSVIASGDHSVRVKYRARDELGTVSRGLNTMAEELQNQISRITSLNESSLRFVPVQFMEHLRVTDITKMKLGAYVQRELSVLFFDIRAFSINSEMMTAKENFLFINEILGIAGPVIRKHKGFVDKYIGDAAMALFVDARDAVRAGIELYRRLVLDEQTSVKIGVDGINIGIGIHSGSVMMGIVGEEERLSSTVISPNVNLASRVESLTKQTKSGLLITKDTLNGLSGAEDEFNYRFVGMIQAAGVNEVVGLFEILDALPQHIRKKRLATKKVFESGIRKYHAKEYREARKRFAWVVEHDDEDACAVNCLAETEKRLEDPALPSIFIFSKK